MKFVLASNNKGKLSEMRVMMGELGYEVISQREAGVTGEAVEDGTTFAENAVKKAMYACEKTGLPAIADDSGLCVDALGGAPGVYSARYGGEGKTDHDRNLLLLENMKNEENRTARFVSAIACVFPDGDIISAEGFCEGRLLYDMRGTNGFGYDPMFYFPGEGLTMAEITPERKNEISHRAKAIAAFGEKLKEYLSQKNI